MSDTLLAGARFIGQRVAGKKTPGCSPVTALTSTT